MGAPGTELLRILLIMDPYILVPPVEYGGIERVVADLANGLHERGHQVTLWAAPGSKVNCKMEPFGQLGEWTRWSNIRNTLRIGGRLIRDLRCYDVVHNFGRLAYLFPILPRKIVKVQTYMRDVNPNNMRKARALRARCLHYTAVSRYIRDTGKSGGGEWSVIYNCANAEEYQFNEAVDPTTAPLLFLGRLERCKGAHTAIAVAKKLDRRLRIAGNVSSLPHEKVYFHREIEPQIDDHLIDYVGPVNNRQKNELLMESAAMLTPIEFEEPFPIVLAESLLCGTPVISFARGGMPEGIDHGKTGFLCSSVEEMTESVRKLPTIDRRVCRAEAERRFSDDAIVTEYEKLYRNEVARAHGIV
jgi:glycosyltransferase involved in cell wall biosynthesis